MLTRSISSVQSVYLPPHAAARSPPAGAGLEHEASEPPSGHYL
jgi:hypothetical protein